MPFYRWDDMKKRNIVPTTDSRGSMILGAGEVVHIPLGVEHELKNPGADVLVYLSFKNLSEDWPPREALTNQAEGGQPAKPD